MENEQKKVRYVKPECLELGAVPSISGAVCATGNTPTTPCTAGYFAYVSNCSPGGTPTCCITGNIPSYLFG